MLAFQGGLDLSTARVVHLGSVPSFEYHPNKIQGSIHALNNIKPISVYSTFRKVDSSTGISYWKHLKESFKAGELIVTSFRPSGVILQLLCTEHNW